MIFDPSNATMTLGEKPILLNLKEKNNTMQNFDFKELIKSPYMYVGLVVGYVLCKQLGKKGGRRY